MRIGTIALLALCLALGEGSRTLSASGPDSVATESAALEQRLNAVEAELQSLRRMQAVSPPTAEPFADPVGAEGVAPAGYEQDCGSAGCGEGFWSGLQNPRQIFRDESYPTVRLTGFFQADAGVVWQDEANRNTVGDAQDGASFRRARLAAVGAVWDNVDYMIEFDFGVPGRPSFMDLWMEITDLPVGKIRVGHFRQPFGMTELTSARELPFLERPLMLALAPLRQIGVMLHDSDDETATTWGISGFRFPVDAFGSNVGDNGGYGMSSRVSTLLFEDAHRDMLVHIGGDYAFMDPASDAIRYRAAPEFFVGEEQGSFLPVSDPNLFPDFLDTGVIDTNHVNLFNAEFGFRLGSFYGQSEVRYAHVDQNAGLPTVGFLGAYGQVAYLLTGEVRPYNRGQGVFGRVEPRQPYRWGSGWGAWEIAARLSWLDLDDQNVTGRHLANTTIGLNWYLNRMAKFQLNYIHSELGGQAIPNSSAGIVAARAQLDF